MKYRAFSVAAAGLAALLLGGCASAPKRIDPAGNEGLTTAHNIDAKDWQEVAVASINSMLRSGAMARSDGRMTVLMISDIKTPAGSDFNTRILTNKITQAVRESGRATATSAVGANGAPDTAVRQIRDLEDDDLFNQSTVAQRGTVVAPDMSLSGEIIQERRSQGRTSESYFLFHIVLTDLPTGLVMWEDNVEIGKQETKSIFD